MSEQEVLKLTSNMTLSKETEVWLRYEPFILHVCCRSLEAAQALLSAARPTFKVRFVEIDKHLAHISLSMFRTSG